MGACRMEADRALVPMGAGAWCGSGLPLLAFLQLLQLIQSWRYLSFPKLTGIKEGGERFWPHQKVALMLAGFGELVELAEQHPGAIW